MKKISNLQNCEYCKKQFTKTITGHIIRRYINNLIVCNACSKRYKRSNSFEYCIRQSKYTKEELKLRRIKQSKLKYYRRKEKIYKKYNGLSPDEILKKIGFYD